MKGRFYNSTVVGGLMLGGVFLAVAARGQVFVSNENLNTISEFSVSGALMSASFISGLNEPIGLANIGNDLFVVNNFSGSIAEYTTAGALVNAHFVTGLDNPTQLVAQGGALYVATSSSSAGNEIMKISGGTTSLFAKLGSISSGSVGGMAFDAHGNLFATLNTAEVIKEVSPSGTVTTFASSVSPTFNLTSPEGLAFDAAGNLYVVDASAKVKWYLLNGTYEGVFASGNLNQPSSLAFDGNGNLDVANRGTSAIEQFSSTGTDLGAFGNANQGAVANILIVPEPSSVALWTVLLAPMVYVVRRRVAVVAK